MILPPGVKVRYRWWHVAILVAVLAAEQYLRGARVHPDGVVLAEPTTTTFLIGVGLALIAGLLLADTVKNPLDGEKPTTLHQRGSFTNWLLSGKEQIQPVFCWAGDRKIKKEKVKGGKGFGSSQKQDVFFEMGLHVLANNGPYRCLSRIVQRGEVLWEGPITPDSHPSGSVISLGTEGSFAVYWGEKDQPVNTILGDKSRLGVSSRWPRYFYIHWIEKRLGTNAVWPVLEYECSKVPEFSEALLPSTSAFIPATDSLSGPVRSIVAFQSGGEGSGYFEVDGDRTGEFKPKAHFELSGNSLADGKYEVLTTEVVLTPSGMFSFVTTTRVFPVGGTVGGDDQGTMQTYVSDGNEGVNPAHLIAEALYAPWPLGLGLDSDQTGPQAFDLDQLDAIGVLAEAEGIHRAGIFGAQGQKAEGLIGSLLQDLGVMVPIDTSSGRIGFIAIREPSGTLPNIPVEMLVRKQPTKKKRRGPKRIDNILFTFRDRTRNYNDMTVAVDDDGTPEFTEYKKARKVAIKGYNLLEACGPIGERRSQEELNPGAAFDIVATRDARSLVPGDAITVEGIRSVVRVNSSTFDPRDEEVTLECMPDYFGVPATDFVIPDGGGPPAAVGTEPDAIFNFAELTEYLLGSEPQTLVPLRIRANSQVSEAFIHISRDNVSYVNVSQETGLVTGGLLATALEADGPWESATGPTIDALGPDIAEALDLSGDPTNWRLGRQLCVIVSTAGVEFCYVQNLTAIGGGQYTLDGFIRGRFETERLAHPAGAEVYVLEETDVGVVQDLLLEPDEDLYMKSQPYGGTGLLPLSQVAPVGRVQKGRGVRPMPCGALRVSAPFASNAYETGDDVTFRWNYQSAEVPGTAAGLQNYGQPHGTSPSPGTFLLKILTLADSEVASIGVDAVNGPVEHTVSNAELVAALGSEVSFKAQVVSVANGLESDPVEITVEFI